MITADSGWVKGLKWPSVECCKFVLFSLIFLQKRVGKGMILDVDLVFWLRSQGVRLTLGSGV